MATGPDLRIGDAERERAVALLREHYAQGRLSLEEFNQRLDATFAATTARQLAQVSRDLPHATSPAALPAPPGPHRERPRGGYRSAPRLLRLLPILVAVTALWVLTVGLNLRMFPWPGRLAIFLAILAFVRGIMRWMWRQAGPRIGPNWPGAHAHGPHAHGPHGPGPHAHGPG